jgi:CRP-like cAMP-binding protein
MPTARELLRMVQEQVFSKVARQNGLEAKISLRSGEFLFQEGEAADAFYIVASGTLRIISGSAVYETVRAGGIVGEMAMVDRDVPRSASVIAGSNSELIRVDAVQFRELVRKDPDFALMVMQVMSRRLRLMNQRYRPQASW